ncbi:MAG: hypothetical protein WC599_13895 [Bacteroidales bacterium]
MKSSNLSKGLHSIKTAQSIRTSTGSGNQNHNFLRLYMLDKERKRLHNEQARLLLRMEPVNNRLKEIDEFFAASLGNGNNTSPEENQDNQDEGGKKWKTVTIDY